MKKMKEILRSRSGSAHILTCCVILAICMIWSALLFYLSDVSVVQAQRKNAEHLLDQYIQNNGIWIYTQIKQESGTTDAVMTEKYLSYLQTQLGLTKAADGKYYACDADGDVRYAMYDVQLRYLETDVPKLRLTYTLHYPMQIFGRIYWVEIPAYACSRFEPKFESES